ncbi:MAG: alpha/beta fold hydrolase [Desulfurococcales archaeon]|nr:alpha/beta fold hydrolase [Desulfurococcales archaeon]
MESSEEELSWTSKIIDSVLSIKGYAVEGVAEGGLIVFSAREDSGRSLWVMGKSNGDKVKLVEGYIGYVRASPRSHWILYSLDISHGRESSSLVALNVVTREKVVIEGFGMARVTGIAWDGSKAGVTVSTDRGFELRIVDSSSWVVEDVYRTDRPIFASDMDNGVLVGTGHLAGDPRSTELFLYYLGESRFVDYTPLRGSTNKKPKIRSNSVLFINSMVRDEILVLDVKSMTSRPPSLKYNDYKLMTLAELLDLGWTSEGKIWFIGKSMGRAFLYIDGRKIKTPQGTIINGFTNNGDLILTYTSFNKPPSILIVKRGKSESKFLLEPKLKEPLPLKDKPRLEWIESSDGVRVPVWVLESKMSSRPGPTIIYIHGGPWSEVSDEWRPIVSSMLYAGFNVVIPNYRGSTGYGEHYRRLIIGDPGGGDVEDVISTASWARKAGLASSIIALGYSYGGYLTLMAMSKAPELFDGGVAGAAITDWREAYELSDALFKRFIEILFNGKGYLMEERSPVNHVEMVKAPLCIIHPLNDTRTPLAPVLKYALQLQIRGKMFEIHIIPGVGHVLDDNKSLRRLLLHTLLFLKTVELPPRHVVEEVIEA